MKIIYGPVASWRLGKSLGIDLICSEKKICSFDCIYCQLEKTDRITRQRESFISLDKLKKDLQHALQQTTPDVITLSGMGEPTLAKNMNEAIKIIKELTDLPLAILTNSSLMYDKNVQSDLKELDIIVAKLDAPNQVLFQKYDNQSQNALRFAMPVGVQDYQRTIPHERSGSNLDDEICYVDSRVGTLCISGTNTARLQP